MVRSATRACPRYTKMLAWLTTVASGEVIVTWAWFSGLPAPPGCPPVPEEGTPTRSPMVQFRVICPAASAAATVMTRERRTRDFMRELLGDWLDEDRATTAP